MNLLYFCLELGTLLFVAVSWVMCMRGCIALRKDLRAHATPRQRKTLTAFVNVLMFAATATSVIVIGSILIFWSR